ncbi:hypothetical protein CPB86DRAFT_797410 [Serendipita vermifera]|nr:hypothetical protein CPB86DRAFT_797410 [Serendipita vermifera]
MANWLSKRFSFNSIHIITTSNHPVPTAPTAPTLTTLFDAAAQRIATLLEEDTENLNPILETVNPAVARAAWSWSNILYPALCSIWRRVFRDNVMDIKTKDEVVGHALDVDSWIIKNEDWLRQRLQDPKKDWKVGLVTLENCDDIFSLSKSFPSFRRITRISVDGWKCLDAKRSETIFIQPNTNSFKSKFDEVTFGQLEGLDWSNIFVAGGIVVVQANKKIEHLFTIFRKNLPEHAPILVVRNSGTISFISKFPQRRFQIILKMVKNPAEVLLNFDLDICTIGYDGECLYMLPRAARALETGYSVFTMDLVQGHYLGTRRASQEERVFKYAYKGYGIRILPSYLEALKVYEQTHTKREEDPFFSPRVPNFDHIMAEAKSFFDGFLRTYIAWQGPLDPKASSTYKPAFAHATMDTADQFSTEPLRRSCLTGFELFYRHVCLWDAEQNGKVEIKKNSWASTTTAMEYPIANYLRNICRYEWDESFKIEDFKREISAYNSKYSSEVLRVFDKYPVADRVKNGIITRKIITGSTLKQVMQENLSIPIWIPGDFLTFARGMIKKVSNDIPGVPFNECFETKFTLRGNNRSEDHVLVNFNLSPVTMFQQIDRRLDEDRTVLLTRQLSRRSLRRKSENEYKDFAEWVRRHPGFLTGYPYGGLGYRFWPQVLGEENSDANSEFDF